MHVCVKMMVKGTKEALTVLIVTHVTQVERVESGVCGFYATLHTELLNLLLMSKGLKVYSVYSGLSPPAKREGYCVSLPSCGFSCSPLVSPKEIALLSFLDLSTTRVIALKMHSQSPILKTKECSATW